MLLIQCYDSIQAAAECTIVHAHTLTNGSFQMSCVLTGATTLRNIIPIVLHRPA